MLEGANIDWTRVAFVQDGVAHESPKPPLKISRIKQAVCLQYGVKLSEIEGPCRAHRISHPRQIGMYLAREFTSASYPQIGRDFGKKDHTTALFAYRKFAGLISRGEPVEGLIELVALLQSEADLRSAVARRDLEELAKMRRAEEAAAAQAEAEAKRIEDARRLRAKSIKRIQRLRDAGFLPEARA